MAIKQNNLKKDNSAKKISINIDLELALTAITMKRPLYDLLMTYYKGDHPLRYSTDRLRKAFDKIGVYFTENWIAVIIDCVLDRLVLKGFNIENNTAADDIIDNIWNEYNLQLMADDVHEAATIFGEGYVIAWKEQTIENQQDGVTKVVSDNLDIYYNDPRMCHVFYDSYRPTEKSYAVKLWTNKDRNTCVILYYPDRFEHYISKTKSVSISPLSDNIMSSGSFILDPRYGTIENPGIEPNETGEIPVFHFKVGRTSNKREVGKSELSIQDAINKLFADMMVASEFYTFRQRVIISQSDPGDLKNGAGINWFVPAGDGKGQASSVQELGDMSLENYYNTIDKLAQALAIISRTPKHYFTVTGGDPSGDALIAMEAPLIKKVKKRQEGYSVEWISLVQYILKLEGVENVNKSDITPTWENIETQQPLADAQTIKANVEAGIPLNTAVIRRGWASDEVNSMEEEKKKEDKKKTGLAQNELDKLRAEQAAQNNTPGNNINNNSGSNGSN